MTKGTIIYIGGFELPDKNAAAHRVLNNGKILRSLGYRVVFISVDNNLKYDKSVLKTKKEIQGFDVWFVPYPKLYKQWVDYLFNIDSFIKVALNYTDIKAVICYNYQSVAFIKVMKYCRKRNIKIFADCTEWPSRSVGHLLFRIIKCVDTFLRMRIIHKKLDGIIVISKYLENYYKKSVEVLRVPPLVDLEEDKWSQSVDEFDDDIIRFVYAGSPGKLKDKLNLVIEALSSLRNNSNYLFYIIGITQEQYLMDHEEHNKLLEDLGEKIIFLGQQPHIDSLKYIKMADFSLFIRDDTRSTRAGFPTKFVESVSCGTPVITSKSSDLEEYIVNGENGFFLRIDSTEKLKKDIEKILLLSISDIKKVKDQVIDVDTFNFHLYFNQFAHFFNQVGLNS
ncbi:MAG: glycosyltransferase family 4 protein [Clostridiaceae bacterium]|nr:glycosyltransferase family 4 protein [Clostridiaceae bacterium]